MQTLTGQLQATVQTLQQSETYTIICQLTDWEHYFSEKRQKLTEQVETLDTV